MEFKYLPLFLLFLVTSQVIKAQTISGHIRDTDNNPVPFATVAIDGTSAGTTADEKGYFSLNTKKSNATLVVRCVGFEETRMNAKSGQELNISLAEKENFLNSVVVTGTRTDRTLKETPVLTKAIQGKVLRETGAVTALDALENIMPGMHFNPNSHGDNIQMQGLDNKYILVLLNGERMVNGKTENVNFSRLNVADIQRIEIIDGAASVLYGSNAIGAVINIITKDVDKPLDASVQGRYSKYNTYALDAALGLRGEKFSSRTVFNRKNSDGYTVETGEGESASSRSVNPTNDFSIRQEFKYRTKKLEASAYGSYFQSLVESPNSPTDSKERDYNIGAKVNYTASDRNALTVAANTDVYKAYTVYKRLNDSTALGNDYHTTSLRVTDAWTPKTGIQLIGGYELNDERSYSVNLFGDDNHDKSAYNNNFFLQGDFKIFGGLEAVVGGRLTQHSEFGVHFTPKVSLMYRLKNFRFRAGVSNGFKAPTLKEMYYSFMMGNVSYIKGNPDLKPEKSWYESLSVEYITADFNASVSVYNNDISNKINTKEYIRTGEPVLWLFENIGDARIRGVDVFAQYNFLNYWNVNAAYAFADAIDKETKQQLYGNSKHNVTAGLMFKYNDFDIGGKTLPFCMSFSGRFSSPRIYESEGATPGQIVRTESKTVSVWKFVYTQRIPSLYKNFGMEMQLGVDNIFNWTDPSRSINPGRMYFASLRLSI